MFDNMSIHVFTYVVVIVLELLLQPYIQFKKVQLFICLLIFHHNGPIMFCLWLGSSFVSSVP